MLVSETSASIAPIFSTACGCSLLVYFWAFKRRVRLLGVIDFLPPDFWRFFFASRCSIVKFSYPTQNRGFRFRWFSFEEVNICPPPLVPSYTYVSCSHSKRSSIGSMIRLPILTPERQSGTWIVPEPWKCQHLRFCVFLPLEVNVARFHVPLIIHLAKTWLRGSEWA